MHPSNPSNTTPRQQFSEGPAPQTWWHDLADCLPLDTSRYRVEGQLAKADRNQGVVFRCFDTVLNTHCAVKAVPQSFVKRAVQSNDTEQPWADTYTNRYMSKVVNSPYVPQWHGCWFDATHVYFASELADQGDLWTFLTTAGRQLPFEDYMALVRSHMREAVAGVAALHGEGIAHLDLSIENVVVRSDGPCALIDLGMSQRLVPSPASTSSAVTYLPLVRPRGKARYMAPEMRRGPYDAMAADVFSLGAMLLLLATTPGSKSYIWASTDANKCPAFKLFLHCGLPALLHDKGVAHRVSPDLMEALEVMLHTDPARRPPALQCLSLPFFGGGRVPQSEGNAVAAGLSE